MKKTYTIPIEEKTISQLYNLWLNNGYDSKDDIDIKEIHMSGIEKAVSEIKLYTYEDENSINSSCITVYDKKLKKIAGLGEVCTKSDSRGKGFAKDLCRIAKEDFFSNSESEGIFLGTVNPLAQKIYENLGWVQIPNSKVMFNSKRNLTFEEFIHIYYGHSKSLEINEGSPKYRIPIIPYFFSEISSMKVDINVGIIGNNYSSMCLSTYNKFDKLSSEAGDWFVVSDNENKIYATSSYICDNNRNFRIDGTYKENFKNEFKKLISYNIHKLNEMNSKIIYSHILDEDKEKNEIFNQLGFKKKRNIKIQERAFSELILE